ncbi:hypothetical protein BC826DRAFT_235254 [Russula brevipes]|nr:hypothetical protein BC826DRAFT_235254 [Russula brevipes]
MDPRQQHARHRSSASNNPESAPYYGQGQSTQQRVTPPLDQWTQTNTTAGNPPPEWGAPIGSQVDMSEFCIHDARTSHADNAPDLQSHPPQPYTDLPVQTLPPSAARSPHTHLNLQGVSMGGPYNMGVSHRPPAAQSPAASNSHVTSPWPSDRSSDNMERGHEPPSSYFGPTCRLPDCHQPCCFDNHVQEQLDYCGAHVYTAISRGFVARCKECRRLPARDNSEHCSASCRRALADSGRASSSHSGVPPGFTSSCQDCRLPMQNDGRRFCSPQCEKAYHSYHAGPWHR